MFLFHLAPWRDLRLGFSTLAELLRDGLRFVKTVPRSRTALAAEILFLRKQLAYNQEHEIRPRRLSDAARLSLSALVSALRLEGSAYGGDACHFHPVASQSVQAVLALEVKRRPPATFQRYPAAHRAWSMKT
jgi:glycine/D-amino acid oxidase-like deaminating enzyme